MLDQLSVRGFGEKFPDALRDLWSHFVNSINCFLLALGELFHRTEMRGEQLRRAFAHERNANRVDQPREAVFLAGLDFVSRFCADFSAIRSRFASVSRSSL